MPPPPTSVVYDLPPYWNYNWYGYYWHGYPGFHHPHGGVYPKPHVVPQQHMPNNQRNAPSRRSGNHR